MILLETNGWAVAGWTVLIIVLSINNARAVLEGLFGKDITFVRTPKHGIENTNKRPTWKTAAYRTPDRGAGRTAMVAVNESVREGVPPALVELRGLGRPLTQRATDVLAYFDRP